MLNVAWCSKECQQNALTYRFHYAHSKWCPKLSKLLPVIEKAELPFKILYLLDIYMVPSFAVTFSYKAVFFVLILHQDKSAPEDQSSWDSFKTMTPELSIVPGEQKDRMELHNKNWDSSSANTPDSSEGDFQTEV